MATLEELRKRRNQLAAQIARAETTERSKARKAEDGRAFLIGRFVQHQLKQGHPVPEIRSHEDLVRLLEPYLVRDPDRARFGLAPRHTKGQD